MSLEKDRAKLARLFRRGEMSVSELIHRSERFGFDLSAPNFLRFLEWIGAVAPGIPPMWHDLLELESPVRGFVIGPLMPHRVYFRVPGWPWPFRTPKRNVRWESSFRDISAPVEVRLSKDLEQPWRLLEDPEFPQGVVKIGRS